MFLGQDYLGVLERGAPQSIQTKLRSGKGAVFRTNLGEKRETAVIFPSKRAGATFMEVREKRLLLTRGARFLSRLDWGVDPPGTGDTEESSGFQRTMRRREGCLGPRSGGFPGCSALRFGRAGGRV